VEEELRQRRTEPEEVKLFFCKCTECGFEDEPCRFDELSIPELCKECGGDCFEVSTDYFRS
jgi:hypothetical protein